MGFLDRVKQAYSEYEEKEKKKAADVEKIQAENLVKHRAALKVREDDLKWREKEIRLRERENRLTERQAKLNTRSKLGKIRRLGNPFDDMPDRL
ncbi:hypothetical protein [Methanocella sp. MCL-LM]|uniref:hypothetical protein n=1 Tax=Methanocella sp. MCL-LM TaxID=3412035 RepID=UPI003C722EC5